MKRCKVCEWVRFYAGPTMSAEYYRTCDRRPKGSNGDGECKVYVRKWWKFWAPKILLLALLLGGCGVEARYTDDKGREFYYRRTGAQQIGEALLELPDGSTFLMDGQKSVMPPIKVTLPHGIIIESGGKEVKP